MDLAIIPSSNQPAAPTAPSAPAPAAPVAPAASKPAKFFPAPPVIQSYYLYQNVNADPVLQKKVTLYFLDQTINWIKTDKSFSKLKPVLRYLKGDDGYDIMHKLLKLFVKKGNTNWYDLKIQKSLVKSYIKYKLSSL
jgi:hypothetical protein